MSLWLKTSHLRRENHRADAISSVYVSRFHGDNVVESQDGVKPVIINHDNVERIGQCKNMIACRDMVFLPIAAADFQRHERDGV